MTLAICLVSVQALPTTTKRPSPPPDSSEDPESITTETLKPDAKQVNIMVVVPPEGTRGLQEEELVNDYENDNEDSDDLELAESIVFRPLYRYNKRRRGYVPQRRHDGYYRRCAPCRPYYFF